MRLFFAYWPSAHVASEIAAWVRRAHAEFGGRMMRTDTLHMTLAFLGQADEASARELVEACATWQLPSGSMVLSEPGRFREPKVVWLGPDRGDPESLAWLYQANRELWAKLAPLGWTPRESEFRPHVSLLRKAEMGELEALKGAPIFWTPERCVLVASEPTSAGSQYTALADIALKP